jgi:choline-glycine betaine transporter
MIFCMAAFISVLLLQKELEEDLTNASPATRYSIFAVLCLCVIGFALHAYRKANRERTERIIEAEKTEQLIRRIETLEAKIAIQEETAQHKNVVSTPQSEHISSQLPLANSSLTTPLLRHA